MFICLVVTAFKRFFAFKSTWVTIVSDGRGKNRTIRNMDTLNPHRKKYAAFLQLHFELGNLL